ncbi:uncharacterized protein LOC123294681 [Chrysoperla carnea]|uniref:uncharacterized protein LOC123294681 n=1 Tax=Chrysoperla carnea TaxID=189513 RepID=UPI001D075389|nr:uncharacterized protein LOC123294681 [Chrysoperla carnea]
MVAAFADNLSIDIGKNTILPNIKDEICQNAFYYAISSSNVELLDTLINKWPGDYFDVHLEELDEILSKAYEELKLKNVPFKLPKLKREEAIINIVSNYPLFEELYNNYEQVKDIYSLEKIANHIEVALKVNPRKKEGRLIIARVLQVTGEYLKNTLESPNISDNMKDILLSSGLQKNSGEIVKSFRNVLSHFYSLKKRIEIEESEYSGYFSNVQNDLKKIKIEISLLREKSKANAIRTFLKQITESEDMKTANKLVDVLISILPDLKEIKLENIIDTREFIQLKGLIDELDKKINDKSPWESKLFDQITKLINSEEKKLEDADINYASQIFNIARIGDHVKQIMIMKSKSSRMKVAEGEEKGCSPIEEKVKDTKAKDCLNKRLKTLRDVLNANGLLSDSNLMEKLPCYKKNKELQLILEILVLDIVEVLQHLGYLENNLLFLDKYSPLLIGRCLRNHLAHGNALINVLQFDKSITVISNALKLVKEEKNLATRAIGRSILDNFAYLKDHYTYNLNIVTSQQEMFEVARKGDIGKIKDYISKGADLKARDINQWTLLHFTTAGGSLEATKH